MYGGLLIVIGGGLALAWAAWLTMRFVRNRRREQLLAEPLRPEWVAVLKRNVPLYRRMPADLQAELRGYVNVFLAGKEFVGCAGLEVTDEMRVTVAGNACLLLLNRAPEHFSGFQSILIYPDTYIAQHREVDGWIVTEGMSRRAGEAWHVGPVVLSWADILKGIADPADGHNVVLHEFAHKLDEENGIVDGLPILREPGDYAAWAKVLTEEFADLVERVKRRKNRVMDSYGASSPPEFFAVATESFFERGAQMQKRLPDLYAQLKKFYGVDPASW